MNRATEGVWGALRRVGGAIRRHPWRTVFALPAAVAIYVAALYPFTPSIGDIRKVKQEQPSIVLSADGKELAVFKRANRDWVKLSDISPKVVEALLATEDRRFYDHHGIDVLRTGKAVLNTLTGDVEGGSTLTQQLARNLYPEEIGRQQTVTRKVKEAITALKLEAIYSKDEILETYLNSVSFLYNAWGIEMAARTYFDKSAKNLNELEAATLVGMLKGTAYYNPVMNPERALERRNTVLAMMAEEGKLPQARYESLKAQPLKLDFERVREFNGPAPHLTEYLRRWLQEWADRNDYNIYADGLVVRTTIDSRLQEMANRAVERQGKALQSVADVEWSRSSLVALGSDPAAYAGYRGKVSPFEYFWSSNRNLVTSWMKDTSEYKAAREAGQTEEQALKELRADDRFMANLRRQKTMVQAGFLALDPLNGQVKAWVGSRDYADDKFDHVQQARRQPGSTFKPFVYGAAFEMGMSPFETLMDAPVEIQIDRNKTWRPTDIDGTTNMPMTLRDGLARSKNTITAQLMMRVGPSAVARLARNMGVRESKLQEVPSLALGTSPVTLKEMVTAFGSIANGGNYIEPQVVTAVEDRNKNVLESFAARSPESAMSSEAANKLLDTMRGVIDSGTAAGLRPRFGLTGDLAGKTGTTQDNTDGWFILMHPRLVAGAWMGFNDNRVAMRSEYWGQGAHNALFVVGDFMQQGQKAGLVDAKASFSAPRLKEEKPVMEQMGDWWNSVFNTAPPTPSAPEVAALPEAKLPEVKLEPPVLEPAPKSLNELPLPPTDTLPPVPPSAPVISDSQPQRVPSFPRPLESARPAETVTGTQVYRTPEPSRPTDTARVSPPPRPAETPLRSSDPYRSPGASARAPDLSVPTDVVRAPAAPAPARSSPPVTRVEPSVRSEPAPRSSTSTLGGSSVPIYDGDSGSRPVPSSAPATSSSSSTSPSSPSSSSSTTTNPPPTTSPATTSSSTPADVGQASGAASTVTTE